MAKKRPGRSRPARRGQRTEITRPEWVRNAAVFAAISAVLVLVWLATGRGSFWPGWVMVAFAAILTAQAPQAFGLRGGNRRR